MFGKGLMSKSQSVMIRENLQKKIVITASQKVLNFNFVLFQNMIDVSLHTPIQDPSVYQFPLDLVSELLQRVSISNYVHLRNVLGILLSTCRSVVILVVSQSGLMTISHRFD